MELLKTWCEVCKIYTVKDFYDAYCWMYGVTKEEAKRVFREISDDSVYELIHGYKNQVNQIFYND